jgi:hypothetical protein
MSLSTRLTCGVKALLERSMMRRELDEVCAVVNAPDIAYKLRCRGFEIPVELVDAVNRYMEPCKAGRYSFTAGDKELARELLKDDK